MIWLAMIQREGKLSCLLIEFIIYFSICFLIKKTDKKKKNKKKKYKYENAIEENIQDVDMPEEFNFEQMQAQIDEIENELNEYEQRVASYDYREFRGRKNVPWIEIYEYLWNQCRYKGIPMWMEYMRQLVKEGVMNEEDKIKVIRKAGDYIPWNPRPDLEAEQNEFREETREQEKKYKYEIEDKAIKQWDKWLKSGLWKQNDYDFHMSRNKPMSLEHKKIFYYEDYLKEIGRI